MTSAGGSTGSGDDGAGDRAPAGGEVRNDSPPKLLWRRLWMPAFAWVAYLAFARSMIYLMGFVAGVLVPRTIDGPASSATPVAAAVAIDVGLLLLFCVHHSVMARARAKRWLLRRLPAAIERSSYVLVSSLLLILLLWQWRPLPAIVWSVETAPARWALWTVCGLGWGLALWASFRLGHMETFGVRQAVAAFRGRRFAERELVRAAPYRAIRHPMYVGFLLGIWATPHMSVGHLIFAGTLTLYIFVGRRFEERDLVRRFGERYERYRRRVPGFLPRLGGRPAENSDEATSAD